MEYHEEWLPNLVPVLVTVTLIIVTCCTIFLKLRLRWPIKINCWFCNGYTKIWRQEINWWRCSSCDQYNGFSKDGDYMYDIPEQYKYEKQSAKYYCKPCKEKSSCFGNNLCTQCNKNERLKLEELTNFEPSNSRKYDDEVKRFKNKLDEKYPLCTRCVNVLQDVLMKQSAWLTQYRMSFFKKKPVIFVINNRQRLENVLRYFLIILDSVTLFYLDQWPLPVAGIFLQLGTCFVAPTTRRISDVFLTSLWSCISLLVSIHELHMFRINFKNEWFSSKYVTKYHTAVILASIIGLMNIKPWNSKQRGTAMTFKKLESPTRRLVPSPKVSQEITKDAVFDNQKRKETDVHKCRSPVNITDLLMTPGAVETPIPIKPLPYPHNQLTFQSQYNNTLATSYHSNNSISSSYYSLQHPSPNSVNFTLFSSLNNLSTLSLSESAVRSDSRAPKVFETKVYDTTSPDLFRKLSRNSNRKFMLAPPKLRSVTQSSWVAGGYWQEMINTPTLSRSSSQSSGFGSAGSNFAPSREPSVYNDIDRCSVVSDATQCGNIPRQVNAQPSNSFYLSYSCSRPDSPSYSPLPGPTGNNAYFQNQVPQCSNCQSNQTVRVDQCLSSSKITCHNISQSSQTPVAVPNGYATMFASPVWLTALLCGSLVFNTIVLCTTLLR
ncbi:uncharacterized protein LOC105703183 [Orussus abietinus]|uniref:uncharacterized protein LOC105703183 n=1 Tax=Orussus abietinus TaxID=222816 RepID=UPI000624FCA7|nr:uncharacterized protein LOC105703183 [Orussus abietinus]